MLPFTTIIDEGLSPYLVVPLAPNSPFLAEFCFEEGEDEDDEEEEDEVLSLLHVESRQRDGLIISGLTFSLPAVCPRSRQPSSFLQPKSGRRMLSMKKFVVL